MKTNNIYQGSELELFAHAKNWKDYWSSVIRPYLGSNVLEVGAGIGSITKLLARSGICWTCLEPDPQQANRIRTWCEQESINSVIVITGTLRMIPADRSYDTIIYIDVLEHIEDDRSEILKAYRHLSETGNLIILVPAHQCLYTAFDRSIGHFRRYNRPQLESLKPEEAVKKFSGYLDSFGLLASLFNRLLLRSSMPTKTQISLWDRRLVPLSRTLDRLLRYRLGKSLVVVWSRH
jgi:protein-L-isoaspartate O-methyltransferase